MGLSPDPAKRARQLANLRPPWQPGDTPNPNGITGPKDFMATVLMRMTQQDMNESADAFIEALRNGSLIHQRELMDRVVGRAIAREEHGDPGDFERRVIIELETVRRELDA